MEEIKKLTQVHKILDFHVKKKPDNVSLCIDSVCVTPQAAHDAHN